MNDSGEKSKTKTLELNQSWFLGVVGMGVILMFAFVIVPYMDPKPVVLSGQEAADFDLELLNGGDPGDRIRLSDLKGQTVIIDFWASWCQPCREQSAILTELAPQLDKEIFLLGVATSDQKAAATSLISAENSGYPNAYDEEGLVAMAYGVTTLPTMVIVDPRGVIRTMKSRIFSKEEILAVIGQSGE